MRSFLYGAFWVAMYLAVSLAPLFVLLVGETPPGRGFWRELSVGLGFVGLSMMGLQFFLTGRFRQITSPYGNDVIYHFHRLVSLIAFSFILLHPIIIFLSAPSTVMFLPRVVCILRIFSPEEHCFAVEMSSGQKDVATGFQRCPVEGAEIVTAVDDLRPVALTP